jgi:vacuolar-type H+-ATPase subunit H
MSKQPLVDELLTLDKEIAEAENALPLKRERILATARTEAVALAQQAENSRDSRRARAVAQADAEAHAEKKNALAQAQHQAAHIRTIAERNTPRAIEHLLGALQQEGDR